MSYKKYVLVLIVVSSCLRFLIAGLCNFGNDEVYYYTYALHLQWNYFDHPPGVALLIRLTTLNLLLHSEFFIRLGSILCAGISTWLCYQVGQKLHNERTGWYAALLYNTSLYSSLIAGTFILPDSPQLVFWLAAMLLMIKMAETLECKQRIVLSNWLLFGLLTGLCIMCKVHGIFLWVGWLLYLLLKHRKAFFEPGLYYSGIITMLIFSPIIWWNIQNHFVTWAYHSNRVAVHSLELKPDNFIQAVLGQFFYNNPINVVLLVTALLAARKRKFLAREKLLLILVVGLPIILIVTVVSLFDNVLPHWSGPGFLTLSFLAAAYLDAGRANPGIVPSALKGSITVIAISIVAGLLVTDLYPGTPGSKQEEQYGKGDVTLDMFGWNDLSSQYQHWINQQGRKDFYGRLKFVCNKWFPAAHIEYYLAEPMHSKVIGVGTVHDLHHFAWLNKTGSDLQPGEDALCIVPSNYNLDAGTFYRDQFRTITCLHRFSVARNGQASRYFKLYLLEHYRPTDEVHTLRIR